MGFSGRCSASGILSLPLLSDLNAIVYPDNQPHNLETAAIQKGIVLAYKGKEVVEEGVGFGTPVALYQDGPRFPLSARLEPEDSSDGIIRISKVFHMDAAPQPYVGFFRIHYRAFSPLDNFFMSAYTKKKKFRSLLEQMINLSDLLGVKTIFTRAEPRGNVKVEYAFEQGLISMKVDSTGLEKRGCQGLVVSNEQGPSFFRIYRDSMGVVLHDDSIGPWEEVQGDEATISDAKNQVSFTLRKVDGARMIRGRERRRRVAWIGLQYIINPSDCFSYEIRVA